MPLVDPSDWMTGGRPLLFFDATLLATALVYTFIVVDPVIHNWLREELSRASAPFFCKFFVELPITWVVVLNAITMTANAIKIRIASSPYDPKLSLIKRVISSLIL
jgi:hypothetical protein